jgi:hypothetical protein
MGFQNWMCVVESVDASNPSDIWSKKEGGIAMHAEISISLLEVDLYNKDGSEYVKSSNIILPYNSDSLYG